MKRQGKVGWCSPGLILMWHQLVPLPPSTHPPHPILSPAWLQVHKVITKQPNTVLFHLCKMCSHKLGPHVNWAIVRDGAGKPWKVWRLDIRRVLDGEWQQKMSVIRRGLYGPPIMRLPKVPLHANLLSMGGRPISTQERRVLPEDDLPMMC